MSDPNAETTSERPESDDRYKVTAAGFLFCIDCGSLVMEGYRNEHERLHPRLSCTQVHAEAVFHAGGHDWREAWTT